MTKLADKIVGYISPKQKKINTLENKVSALEGVIKDELYTLFIEKLGEPAEMKRLKKDNAFIRSKLFWDGTTLVTRSKAKSKGPNLITKGIRTFEVYNAYGGSVKVEYQNENEVLYTTHEDLIKQYFEERNINAYGK